MNMTYLKLIFHNTEFLEGGSKMKAVDREAPLTFLLQ